MHRHGGGYSDIKEPFADWSPAFTRIEDDPNIWMVGYQQPSSKDCARIESNLGRDLRVARASWPEVVRSSAAPGRR